MPFEAARIAALSASRAPARALTTMIHCGQFMLLRQPERFTDQALDAITRHRIAHRCGRRSPIQGGERRRRWVSRKYREERVGRAACVTIHAIEFGFLPQALRGFESSGRSGDGGNRRIGVSALIARSDSHSETIFLRPFARRRARTLTTCSRGHAGTKAVSALTFADLARLICALHADRSREEKLFLESSAKTSTWWGGTKGGKGTQRFPGCQAESRLLRAPRRQKFRDVRAVDNPASIGIDSPSFRVARAE